ncbi:MAG: hypothetical protein ACM34H_03745 [Deltaproteobacteria bacterium]
MKEEGKDFCTERNRIPRSRGANPLNLIRGMALVLAFGLLAAGCATPKVQPADPQLIFKSDMLGFLQDGVTTRDEVVLKLGIPSAQIEGERILMYQLKADENGKWHLIAPQWNVNTGLRTWSEGTCSLVLVFGENSILQRHSLVMAQ